MSIEFVSAESGFRSAMGVEPPTPEYRDPVSAAFRMENPIVNIAKRTFEDTYPVEPDHNPLGIISNTPYEERHLDKFLGSTSENMTRSIMARIDQEEQDRRTLDAAGFGGVMLQMLAGVLDPTIALPAGTIYRTGRAGYSLARSGASVGGAAALQAGVSESVLQAAQETRTLGESATAVASATLLGALIGGGASRLLTPAERALGERALDVSRARHDAHVTAQPLTERIDEAAIKAGGQVFTGATHADAYGLARQALGDKVPVEDADGFVTSAGRYVGREEAKEIADLAGQIPQGRKLASGDRLVAEDFGGEMGGPEFADSAARSAGAAAADTRELSPVPYGLDKIPVVGKLFSKLFPTLNALQNGDLSTRRIVSELATFPGRVKDNLTGGTTTLHGGPAIDLEVSIIRNGRTALMGDELLGLWAEQRFGSRDVSMPSVRAALAQVTGDVPAGKLSFDDFDAAVYDAMSQGDKHEIPQVAAAAQWIRREVLEPLSTRAEQSIEGFQKIEPREGESYAPRMWNQELIRARWNDFVSEWTNVLERQQTVKAGIQGRLRSLNDELQAAGKQMEKAKTPEALADATLRHDALRTRIEEQLAAWEGKSTKEAKTAIKAREKYAAEAARETDAPRLRSADKAVDDTVKKIIESKRDLSRQDLQARAQEIASRHIGTPEGRLPYDVDMGGPQIGVPKPGAELRGHLAKREVDLPYQVAAPWLDKSATRSIRSYLHSVLPDTIIAERMSGDPNMLAAFKEIESSYAARLAGAKSEKESKALLAQRDTDMKIVAGIRDRIRGTFGFDPDMKYTGRVSQAALRINNIVSSHMMAVSSLPDFAGAIFRHGLESAFSDGWRPFAKAMMDNEAWQAWKKHGQEWRAFGIGVETKIAARQHAIDDINELHRPASRGERALAWASDKSFIVNLLSLETDLQKRILANVSSHNILRAAKAVAEGKASQKQIALLGESNIKPHVAEKIWNEFQGAGGDNIDGVLLPNLADWKSQEAKLAFTGAVVRDVEIGVVTPGQEKPLWMSKPGWNVLGQYKSFTASATMRILVANLQRSDAAALQGLIASVGLGMLAYRINTMASGQPTSDRVQDWVKEGISRSGVLGWLDEGNTVMAKASRGGVDAYRLIGADKPLSRYVSRSASDIFLGPTYGKIQNMMRVGGALGSKEWTEGDTHALRMSLLGSNLPYLPRLFEQVEKGFNGAFGIEMKAKP